MVISDKTMEVTEKQMEVATVKILEKEVGQLANIRDILKRSNQVANNVENILDSFDHRLGRLEQTILPLYQQTGNLQRRQQNTEKTLQALDFVISYYNVAGEVEGLVRERPSSIGLQEYLKAMDKLKSAAGFFEANNPQSSELENVKSLFEYGCQQLIIEFRDELKKYQKPIPPTIVLELIELEENELTEELLDSVGLIPSSVREELNCIASWLDRNGTSDRLTVFAKQRGFVLSESLKLLRTYERSGSGDRGMQSHAPSPGQSPGFSAPKQSKTPKLDVASRIRAAKISQKATRAIFRAMPVQSPLRWQGNSRSDDTLDEHEVALHITQVSALHRLSLCELLLTRQLVPRDKVSRTFELIIREAISELLAESENLALHAHKCVSKGDIQAIQPLLALLRHMTSMQRQFNALLKDCQESIKAQFSAVLATLQETTGNALEAFVASLRSEGERALPSDGTVHELTSNCLVFLEQLIEFSTILSPILRKEAANVDSAKVAKHPAICLGFYIKKVLSNLGFSLVHRSASYSDPYLCAIFRLNNYNYVLNALLASDLITIVALAEPHCAATYEALILEQKEAYAESLKKLLHFIEPNEELSALAVHPNRMRDKDRQLLKDRFSGFNKEVEDMQKAQRGYSIPDLELRESIKRDNKEQILPKYQAFYDRFSQLPFSKSTSKYVKYTPADISHKFDEFFDVAA